MFIDTARATVEAHIKVLDAVTVRRVVHQVAVEQFDCRVGIAGGVDIGREFIESDVLAAMGLWARVTPIMAMAIMANKNNLFIIILVALILDSKGK